MISQKEKGKKNLSEEFRTTQYRILSLYILYLSCSFLSTLINKNIFSLSNYLFYCLFIIVQGFDLQQILLIDRHCDVHPHLLDIKIIFNYLFIY